jgi:hypothetical protein
MLVFAISDKGGTGRSVTGSNVAYRRALLGGDVCYLDFDFGSPTVGAIFDVGSALRGVRENGLHSYFEGKGSVPVRIDLWTQTDRISLRERPLGAGRLVLLPGDEGGGEFPSDEEKVRRCAALLLQLESEFDLVLVDLSAGRSYAVDMVLEATALPELRGITSRWLVFHRWTRQHIVAAAGLVYEPKGILDIGADRGHSRAALAGSIRFIRTAVVHPEDEELAGLSAEQIAWLRSCNDSLQELAREKSVGRTAVLGEIPLDPVLQWREQLITDNDVALRKIANERTADAFAELAERLADETAWRSL